MTVLPDGGGGAWLEAGIAALLEVDTVALVTTLHKRVPAATVSGRPFHDMETARTMTGGWAHPRTWLDFETIAFPIPRRPGMRPHQPARSSSQHTSSARMGCWSIKSS